MTGCTWRRLNRAMAIFWTAAAIAHGAFILPAWTLGWLRSIILVNILSLEALVLGCVTAALAALAAWRADS